MVSQVGLPRCRDKYSACKAKWSGLSAGNLQTMYQPRNLGSTMQSAACPSAASNERHSPLQV